MFPHLYISGKDADGCPQDRFTCQWENCLREFPNKKKLSDHLERHSYDVLVCAYTGM